ncbi:MAG TPA: trigger factor [Gammaproteobacteria bacterium]|jgi:trigger factor|nr:trigger factor [Gammaproteobacteria bacterium]
MQVSLEKSDGLERRMKVQVPAERVEREMEDRLKSLSKRAKVDGFRPGKVPFKVVKQRFGEQIRSEVVTDLLQSSFNEALAQQKLNPAGGPRIDSIDAAPGKDLKFTAVFEVYPEIKLKGVEGIKVERPVAEVAKEDIDAMVDNLRHQRATWEAVERAAKDGDRVLIDFEGSVDGVPFPGGKGERVPVVLGEKRMLPDFEQGLQGIKSGESREFGVKFPADYHAKELAGKQAQFKVSAHAVEGQVLPALDDAFCKAFGISEGGIEKLRTEVADNMKRELDETIRRKLKDQALEALLKANKLDLPKSLVDEEIERLRHDALVRIGVRDAKKASELPRELFEEQAVKRVSLGLLVGEVINQQRLTVDPKRVDERLQRMAGEYSTPAEAVRSFRANQDIMRQVETLVLEEQAVDWLLGQASVTDKPTTFKALMNLHEHDHDRDHDHHDH